MGCLWSSDRRSRTAEVGESPSFAHLIVKSGTSGFSSVQGRKKGENYFASEETIPSSPDRKAASKVQETGSVWGRAGVIGLEKAVGVIDTLGSTVSHLNSGSGFLSGVNHRGNKITILAFEVANTISKGQALLHSLSENSVQQLKREILHSEGVHKLVSTDHQEIMRIAAADKREELNAFCREVSRFGDLCKDPQWHSLSRYFQKLETNSIPLPGLKEEAEATMQHLVTLSNHTAELYHEMNILGRYELDYRRRLKSEEESLPNRRREDRLMNIQGELKRQRKLVETMKKKSLWSKNLEELVEKLVDIITSMYNDFFEAFGQTGANVGYRVPRGLGSLGLSLHYASVINLIDNAVSPPMLIPNATRDSIYRGLPASVKAALRARLASFHVTEKLSGAQIKAEMQKILQWLAPMAENTTKAHQGFGWVGEWANTSMELNQESQQTTVIRILTLHHTDKDKTDEFILQLAVWIHHLGMQVKSKGSRGKNPKSVHERRKTVLSLSSSNKNKDPTISPLSEEDRQALEELGPRRRNLTLKRSISLGHLYEKARKEQMLRNRSYGDSPIKEFCTGSDVHVDRTRDLDVIDGLDRVDQHPKDIFSL